MCCYVDDDFSFANLKKKKKKTKAADSSDVADSLQVVLDLLRHS